MKNPKILVTGATGKTGRSVVVQLLEKGWPVRAVVRSHDSRSQQLQSLGAEVVLADLLEPEQMLQAALGTQRAYYCPPMHPEMLQMTTTFALAAREAKLETIVTLSQWLASPNHPSLLTRQSWHSEQLLSAIPGTAHIILRPGYFADNYLRLLDFASLLGLFPILTGNSRNAPPSNEDIARSAVALLMNPAPHAGQSYRITGPELLSAYQMAEIVRKVLRSPVLPVNLPFWMLVRAARLQGETAFTIAGLRHYIEDHKQGAFEFGAPTDAVLQLTGRPAEPFENTVRRYAAMPFAKRTWANRFHAFANFLRVPFSPGFDLNRYDREPYQTPLVHPQYAMQNESWKLERAHTPSARLTTLKVAS